MKLLTLFFILIFHIQLEGQGIGYFAERSPDNNYKLSIFSKEIGDSNVEHQYFLTNNRNKDSILITTAVTHDETAPCWYWDKSSTKLIFENQAGERSINILDLDKNKVIFQTEGIIEGKGKHNFDRERGLIFYFKATPNDRKTFEILSLNLQDEKIKSLASVKSSGDPITGVPEIIKINTEKRELIIASESEDYKSQEKIVRY